MDMKYAIKITVLMLFLCLFSCDKEKKKEVMVGVVVYTAEPQTVPLSFEFVGVCQSSHLVEIRSRVQGYLDEVTYVEGASVEEGQVLFRIDPREFKSKLEEVEASLEKEKAVLWSAERAVARYEPLFEKKAASRKDLDNAEATLLAQQATVNLFEAKKREAELNLSYTVIRSPIKGFTTNSRYQEGSLITPGANDLLTTVSVIDPIWVIVNVSNIYFVESKKQVAEGKLIIPPNYDFDVSLKLADGSKYPYPGKVNFISPVLDPDTGTLTARGIFPNPDDVLKPGQFVRANVMGAKRINTIIVPQSAVLQGDSGRFVYIVNSSNQVERREVVTGDWHKEYWIIESGLKKGDRVIQEGVNRVKDGMVVRILNRNEGK